MGLFSFFKQDDIELSDKLVEELKLIRDGHEAEWRSGTQLPKDADLMWQAHDIMYQLSGMLERQAEYSEIKGEDVFLKLTVPQINEVREVRKKGKKFFES